MQRRRISSGGGAELTLTLTFLSSGSDTGPSGRPGNSMASFSSWQLLFWRVCMGVHTDCGFDLAVIRRHAVPMVQVGEGLGGAPGLQVAGHSD